MKPLLIRADAGGELGSGHVMRMIALAQAWMDRGGEVSLASVRCPEKLEERLREEGIHPAKLQATTIGSAEDLAGVCKLAGRLSCEWIVLDGYTFGFDYQKQLTKTGNKLLVMDDFLYSPEWCADLIVNQNPDCDPNGYANRNPGGQVLQGSDYVLLRKEFWAPSVPKETAVGSIKLLVSMGGVDADNLTGSLLEILNAVADSSLEIRVVLGGGNPHEQELRRLINSSPHRMEVHIDVRDMSMMYSWADAVITAAGGTVWEWLRYGHRGGFIVVADNQRKLADWLISRDLGIELGSCAGGMQSIDKERLIDWLQTAHEARHSESGEIVDGAGSTRVVDCMLKR